MAVQIPGETKSIAGRKPNPIIYKELEDCIECTVQFNNTPLQFFIDKDDLEKVKTRNWHATTGGLYIGANLRIDGVIKTLYLHNFVMNKLDFSGKGVKQTIDHINRNGLDNRKSNLRLVTQTEQNLNQNPRSRWAELPEQYQNSEVKIYDLPKHVYYVKARGNHGDGFCVELKKDGKKIYNPYIRSKVLTIEQKLEKIKELLQKGYELYPEFIN
jgi:hypothetical protein